MYGKQLAVLFGSGNHLVKLCGIHRHRLFANDVLPRLQRLYNDLFVRIVRNRNRHQIHFRIAQYRFVGVIGKDAALSCQSVFLLFNIIYTG